MSDKAIEELASRLYWITDRAAPGLEDEVKWADLPDDARDMFRGIIRDLSRYADLWKEIDEAARRVPLAPGDKTSTTVSLAIPLRDGTSIGRAYPHEPERGLHLGKGLYLGRNPNHGIAHEQEPYLPPKKDGGT